MLPLRRRDPLTWCVLAAAAAACLLPAAARSQESAPRPAAATTQGQSTRPADGPATRPASSPATRPARSLSADEMLGQMLRPPATTERPLAPVADPPAVDRTSGRGAVPPSAPVVNVRREGTFLVDRVGRLTRDPDGGPAEFTFDSDGKALRDPPVVIIPNLKLMAMEEQVAGANRDLRFKVSGMLTEYRGRNYILLEKVVVVPENETFRDF